MSARIWGADWANRPAPTTAWPYSRVCSLGLAFVGRYVGMTATELSEIRGAGLGCYVFSESGPASPLRGVPQADADVDAALAWASWVGWRAPIVFACDTEIDDATPTLPYYARIAARLGPLGRAYGDTKLLDGLYAAGLKSVAAGVGCSAWSYGTHSRWEVVHQYFDDFPAALFPNLEAAGLHYGSSYDANELMLPLSDLISWPGQNPYDVRTDDVKCRFVIEKGDTRVYFEQGAQLAWMTAWDAVNDYAAREGISNSLTVVRPNYLAGRPGKLSTIPPVTKLAAHLSGFTRDEVSAAALAPHFTDTADPADVWPWATADHPDALKREGQ